MKPLYIIVHEEAVTDPEVLEEINRIKREEEHLLIEYAGLLPVGIPKSRKIMVCGAFVERCVEIQRTEFEINGYDAEIYQPASQYYHLFNL